MVGIAKKVCKNSSSSMHLPFNTSDRCLSNANYEGKPITKSLAIKRSHWVHWVHQRSYGYGMLSSIRTLSFTRLQRIDQCMPHRSRCARCIPTKQYNNNNKPYVANSNTMNWQRKITSICSIYIYLAWMSVCLFVKSKWNEKRKKDYYFIFRILLPPSSIHSYSKGSVKRNQSGNQKATEE